MATLSDEELLSFPNLNSRNHRITSAASEKYNCIGWALGFSDGWWQPGTPYWRPEDWPADDFSLGALERLFREFGFSDCDDDPRHEAGFEKVALYGFGTHLYSHAARQLANGKWSSKLGESHDIQHDSPADLEGQVYGTVLQIMKRPIA